ncbi:MAG TPA: lysophospholipid acyltransferase family protein [Gemmataceae bacterium]|nr:lysophospholipid acyltransferase family protein [Gemmataceae bacterium]
MPDWFADLWYEAVSWVSAAGALLGFSARVEGGHHIPRRGPVLLLANHQCYLDPVFVGLATRRRLCFLARKNLWRHKALGWLISSLNAFPVDQEGVAKEGLRTVLDLLGRGRAVLIFPEGQRTWDGKMGPLKPGVHLLIKRARPPIVPVGIAGAYDAWPRWRPYPLPAPLFPPVGRGTVAVSVGKPIDPGRFADLPREKVLTELFAEIHALWQRAERLRRRG